MKLIVQHENSLFAPSVRFFMHFNGITGCARDMNTQTWTFPNGGVHDGSFHDEIKLNGIEHSEFFTARKHCKLLPKDLIIVTTVTGHRFDSMVWQLMA